MVDLTSEIIRVVTKPDYRQLRNLGDPAGVAKKMYEDRRGRGEAERETAATEYAVEQLKTYRRMRSWINNLIMRSPRVRPDVKESWRPIRGEVSKQESYWSSVLETRGESYQRILRRMSRRRVAELKRAKMKQEAAGTEGR